MDWAYFQKCCLFRGPENHYHEWLRRHLVVRRTTQNTGFSKVHLFQKCYLISYSEYRRGRCKEGSLHFGCKTVATAYFGLEITTGFESERKTSGPLLHRPFLHSLEFRGPRRTMASQRLMFLFSPEVMPSLLTTLLYVCYSFQQRQGHNF